MDDRVLENPESWDFPRAERRPGLKGTRAIVSVAFARDDFQRVADAAKEGGQRTSEFIRQAALEKALRQGFSAPRHLTFSSSLGAVFFTRTFRPETRVSGPAAEVDRNVVTA
jgi:hypothetical protein